MKTELLIALSLIFVINAKANDLYTCLSEDSKSVVEIVNYKENYFSGIYWGARLKFELDGDVFEEVLNYSELYQQSKNTVSLTFEPSSDTKLVYKIIVLDRSLDKNKATLYLIKNDNSELALACTSNI